MRSGPRAQLYLRSWQSNCEVEAVAVVLIIIIIIIIIIRMLTH